MPLENDILLKIEELKEVGHEYRYREQIMVQEFGLSMLVAGVAVGVVHANTGTVFALVVQCYGLGFLALLTLHLRNINQDRYAALAIKEKIRSDLGFQPIHQNTGDRKHRFISISSTRAIFLFSFSTALGWAIWLAISALS
ncbi:putative membrane protein [Bradyrhizobium sp. USDA 4461]